MQLKEEPQTVLTHDTRTVEPSQVTTCFCGSWMGTVEMAKTTTNFCSAFTTTFGSGFCQKKSVSGLFIISDFASILTPKNPICRKRQEPLKRLRLGIGTVAVFHLSYKALR